jgi:hypothetical protein
MLATGGAYESTLRLNRHVNRLRARLGLPYWSLSKYLKHKVKRAVSYVGDLGIGVTNFPRQSAASFAQLATQRNLGCLESSV